MEFLTRLDSDLKLDILLPSETHHKWTVQVTNNSYNVIYDLILYAKNQNLSCHQMGSLGKPTYIGIVTRKSNKNRSQVRNICRHSFRSLWEVYIIASLHKWFKKHWARTLFNDKVTQRLTKRVGALNRPIRVFQLDWLSYRF